jgi:hypothetical protein
VTTIDQIRAEAKAGIFGCTTGVVTLGRERFDALVDVAEAAYAHRNFGEFEPDDGCGCTRCRLYRSTAALEALTCPE